MGRLRARELDALVEFVADLGECDDVVDLRSEILTLLSRAVPSDLASYNEIGASPDDLVVVADPRDTLRPDMLEAFAVHNVQNPLVARHMRDPDDASARLSDHMTDRELRATDLYDLVYRHLEIRYQAAITVPAPDRVIGITVSRGARDFGDGEVSLIRAARPFVVAALRNIEARRRIEATVDALGTATVAPSAILLVGERGRLEPADERSERWLHATAERVPGLLDELLAWAGARPALHSGASIEPRRVGAGADAYTARYVPARVAHPGAIVIERVAGAPTLEDLVARGLTNRQAEIMLLVGEGRTNAQVAAALGVSPRTVAHHLEHVFERLGVCTRMGAVRELASPVAPT